MAAREVVATTPAQLVRSTVGFGLYFRITVTNVAANLVSLLPGGALPRIPMNPGSGDAPKFYAFKFVDMWSETDPAAVKVRFTDDGQTIPTATLGRVVPLEPSFVRSPCDAQDVKLISAGANVNIQCYLGIGGLTEGTN